MPDLAGRMQTATTTSPDSGMMPESTSQGRGGNSPLTRDAEVAYNYAVAEINPIRYRGYYRDSETGWYFCQTRYYNPQWRRFINADVMFVAGDDLLCATNLYAYCNGNPVMGVDPSGMDTVDLIMGAAFVFLSLKGYDIAWELLQEAVYGDGILSSSAQSMISSAIVNDKYFKQALRNELGSFNPLNPLTMVFSITPIDTTVAFEESPRPYTKQRNHSHNKLSNQKISGHEIPVFFCLSRR